MRNILKKTDLEIIDENPGWLLAKELRFRGRVYDPGDSRMELELLGFTIIRENEDLFYNVIPPEGWKKYTEGHWTTIKDTRGRERLSQCYEPTLEDPKAFLNVTSFEG